MTTQHGQVSGHYAGIFTRCGAFVIDWFFLITVYGIMLGAAQYFSTTLFEYDIDYTEGSLVWLVGFFAWAFLYLAGSLTVTGRTVGKLLLGLKVVTRDGRPLTVGRASTRVIAMPLSFLPLGLGLIGILLGRERRALHDVIARTAVVYDWGDRPAEMPAPMTKWLENKGVGVAPQGAEAGGERAEADLT